MKKRKYAYEALSNMRKGYIGPSAKEEAPESELEVMANLEAELERKMAMTELENLRRAKKERQD
jgi:hypothetical protein